MLLLLLYQTSEIAAVILSGSGGAKDLQKCFSSGSSHATDSDDDYTFVDHPDDLDNGGDPKTSAASSPKLQVDWAYLSNCPVQVSADGEASRGGAVLSAAEMESCKQYVENEDGEASLAYAVGPYRLLLLVQGVFSYRKYCVAIVLVAEHRRRCYSG